MKIEPITKAQFPPIKGSVEVSIDGKRSYKKVEEEAPKAGNNSETVTWDDLAIAYTEGVNSIG